MLELLKRKLKITWEDDDTNQELTDLINESTEALNHLLGASYIDYKESYRERELLLNRCMYAYNNVLEDFENAYKSQIIQLRMHHEVMSNEFQD